MAAFSLVVEWTHLDPADASLVIIRASRPVSAGRSAPGTDLVDIVTLGIGDSSTDVGPYYEAILGMPPIGSKIFVELEPVWPTSGITGTPLLGSVVVQ